MLGAGTTANPYVISAADPPPTEITGLVTAGTNVQVTGLGTPASPYTVSSVQDLDDLSDVVISTPPGHGSVLNFDTSVGTPGTWVPQIPPWVPQNPEQRSWYLVTGSTTWDVPSVATGTQVSTNVSVPGVNTSEMWFFHVVTDRVMLGLHPWAQVTNVDVVTIYLSNMTGSAINPTSGTYRVYGWR
jgi:hypothetical protein